VRNILQFDEDDYVIIVLRDNLNSKPQGLVGIFCPTKTLSNKMNFLDSVEARFNIVSIGNLNGENICAWLVMVQRELKLKAKHGKMVQPQSTLETNVDSFAT
jgi:hypothetical protein